MWQCTTIDQQNGTALGCRQSLERAGTTQEDLQIEFTSNLPTQGGHTWTPSHCARGYRVLSTPYPPLFLVYNVFDLHYD